MTARATISLHLHVIRQLACLLGDRKPWHRAMSLARFSQGCLRAAWKPSTPKQQCNGHSLLAPARRIAPASPGSHVSHSGCARARARRVASCRASASAAPAASSVNQLPQTPVAMVEQAAAAVRRGLDAGLNRQMLTLLLPVNEKEYNFLNTEPVDYPCSLQKVGAENRAERRAGLCLGAARGCGAS